MRMLRAEANLEEIEKILTQGTLVSWCTFAKVQKFAFEEQSD